MRKIYCLFALACFALAGCDKFLDIKPKDIFIPRTLEHYDAMLDNRHVILHSDMYIDLMTDDAYLPELDLSTWQGPAKFNLFLSHKLDAQRIYKFDPKPFSEADTDYSWSETHNRLFYFNTVINNVLEAQEGSEAERRRVWAEALLQRAIEHFHLVNLYAMHYDPATAADTPGIPITTEADINAKFKRSTVEETYKHIIKDIEDALPYLPEKPAPTKYRASHPAGLAMMAKVYFTMGDYATALTWVEQALAKQNTLIDFNDHKNKLGWVFGPGGAHVPNSPVGWTDIPDGKNHPESILNRTFLRPFGLGQDVCPSPELQALFDRDNDMRWYFWYADGWPPFNPTTTFMSVHGVRLHLRGEYFNNCLTTPEMYLIRAECYARGNQPAKALADINHLRKHRLRPEGYTELTTADFGNDAERILRFVLEERRRELAFTGNRHIDLKRLNKEPRFAKTITHTADGVTYTLEPNSKYYVRELWSAATNFNPNWELNFPELARATSPEKE